MVVGGTPGYRSPLAPGAPQSMAEFEAWLFEGALNPSTALFRAPWPYFERIETWLDGALW